MDFDGIKRARLASFIVTDDFKLIQEICEDELKKFELKFINTKVQDDKEVLANHALWKAAAQFYQGIINRINSEVELYRLSPKVNDKPEDTTEGVLDLGELTKELPNFFADEGDFE